MQGGIPVFNMANEQQKKTPAGKVVPAPFAKRQAGTALKGKLKAKKRTAKPPRPTPPRRRKRSGLMGNIGSFFLLVLLPVLATGLYYVLFAADQYMVETRFSVRSSAPNLSGGLLSSLGLGLGGSSSNDTYIILEYIHSREILKRIDRKLDLKRRYRRPEKDFYAALGKNVTMDDFLDYWKSMVSVSLDHTSQIITVNTFAFSPDDTRAISAAILAESERMINDLSERARQDAVAYAKSEVMKAEKRVRDIRQRFLKFRNANQQSDPAKQAQVQVMLVGKLEEQLAELRTKLSEALGYLSANAPTVVFLKNRIKAVKRQIAEEKRKLGDKRKGRKAPPRANGVDTDTGSLSMILSEYETLLVEREFAEKFYLSALKGLEEARLLANRQQRYLATFERPYLPDSAQYPKKIRNTFFVFLSLTLIWALGKLILQSVLDRM